MSERDFPVATEAKIKVYGSLAETNRAFGTIINQARELEQTGFLTPNQSERFRLTAQHFQSDMNYCVTNHLSTQETEEAKHYQDLRIAFEQALNPPADSNSQQNPPEPGESQ